MSHYHEKLIFDEVPGYPSCHASTIVALPGGELLVVWYAGEREAAADVALLQSRRGTVSPADSACGRGWSQPEVIVKTAPDLPEGNPVLFLDPTDRLWLFYVTMHGRGWSTCKLKYRHSTDGGRTWGDEVILRDELGWMYRNKPLVLRSGRILLPLYDEIKWASLFGWSDDGGGSWQYGDVLPTGPGNIQPSPVQLADGSLCAIMRSGGTGYLWEARSTDDGETWTEPEAMKLRNPDAGADMTQLPNGHLVLAFNDSSERRTPLSLALSEDEGRTWPHVRHLETDDAEFSYPALIADRSGLLHLTYTYRRTHIKYVECDEAWIKGE